MLQTNKKKEKEKKYRGFNIIIFRIDCKMRDKNNLNSTKDLSSARNI